MTSNLAAAPGGGASGGYNAVAAQMRALQSAAHELAEQAEGIQQRMRSNARSAAELGSLCAAAEVDPVHTARIEEVSAAFGRVAGGGARIVAAADSVGHAAGHVKSTHQGIYGPIHEVVTSLPGGRRQPKPGFNRQR